MAVAEAAKIVFQTALAGTLESKGFRRVSDTNYVIEGDGIEWRVVFGPEYKDEPGSFREETGIFISEVDRLCLALESQSAPLSLPMARTKYRAHFWKTVSAVIDSSKPYGERDYDPSFVPEDVSSDRRAHWATKGHDLEALGCRINDYWLRDTWPWLKDRLTLQTACGPLPSLEWIPGDQRGIWFEFLQWWACGHRDLVIEKLANFERNVVASDDQLCPLLKTELVSRAGHFWPFSRIYRRLKPIGAKELEAARKGYKADTEEMREIIDLLGIEERIKEKLTGTPNASP